MQKDVSLGERLRFRRNALNLTQPELAQRAGLSERSVSDYERGLSLPSVEQLKKLAYALSVRSGYLLGEETIIEADQLRDVPRTDVVGYSSLESEALIKILGDLTSKLRKFAAHERKHVLGNMRAIIDVLEEREMQNSPPKTRRVSSAPISDAGRLLKKASESSGSDPLK